MKYSFVSSSLLSAFYAYKLVFVFRRYGSVRNFMGKTSSLLSSFLLKRLFTKCKYSLHFLIADIKTFANLNHQLIYGKGKMLSLRGSVHYYGWVSCCSVVISYCLKPFLSVHIISTHMSTFSKCGTNGKSFVTFCLSDFTKIASMGDLAEAHYGRAL